MIVRGTVAGRSGPLGKRCELARMHTVGLFAVLNSFPSLATSTSMS